MEITKSYRDDNNKAWTFYSTFQDIIVKNDTFSFTTPSIQAKFNVGSSSA